MIQFAECGCVGIVIDSEHFWCLKPCDCDMEAISVYEPFVRQISELVTADKQTPFADLTREEENKVIADIGKLVTAGNHLAVIKNLLKTEGGSYEEE